ncbi:hypothetical protein L6R52_22895 [Myxococcota bacterium]|nr:hypothetical protein [Myxococcota bacterium]
MVSTAEVPAREPIVIYRSLDGEGATFSLDRRSEKRLRAAFAAEMRTRSRIFIAHETKGDFERIHGPIAGQIITLLTGLSEERLEPLGDVVFRDPVTEEDLPRC